MNRIDDDWCEEYELDNESLFDNSIDNSTSSTIVTIPKHNRNLKNNVPYNISITFHFDESEDEDSDDDNDCSNFKMNKFFNDRLQYLQLQATRHQYKYAYLNTIGGAYHLCNHPKVALKIAREQEELGKELGSQSLIVRAKSFQAVNIGLLGKKKYALKWLKKLEKESFENGQDHLIPFIKATRRWLETNVNP
jgi:hypothetical protein